MKHVEVQDSEAVKSFGEHIEDLRRALIKSLVAIVAAGGACFYFADRLVDFLKRPLVTMVTEAGLQAGANGELLRALRPAEPFLVSMTASLVAGIIIASPFVFYQLWRFVSPGLKRKERRLTLPIFVCGALFFFIGVAFAYLVVVKICLGFFWRYGTHIGIQNDWTIGYYVSFVGTLLLAFGVAFEMPVVSALLARLNLVTARMLAEKGAYAILGIFIAAAVLTPPDVVSQILLAIPMIGLYGISILAAKLMEPGPKMS